MIYITDFGAVGDGKTMNTEAFRKAIAACKNGEAVAVPPGIFLTGTINLNGVSLYRAIFDDVMRYIME